jgi:hypothetical protein
MDSCGCGACGGLHCSHPSCEMGEQQAQELGVKLGDGSSSCMPRVSETCSCLGPYCCRCMISTHARAMCWHYSVVQGMWDESWDRCIQSTSQMGCHASAVGWGCSADPVLLNVQLVAVLVAVPFLWRALRLHAVLLNQLHFCMYRQPPGPSEALTNAWSV